MLAEQGFLQAPPQAGNQLLDDEFALSLLHRLVPPDDLRDALPDLERFGWQVATSIKELGQQAEREPPAVVHYDAWGARVDTVVTSPAWQLLKEVAAREGLVASAYERRHAQHSRLLQLAKLYLFGASSGLFNCPLAMTDGAARLCMLLMLPEGLGQAGRRDCAQPAPLPALGGSAGGQAGQRQAGQGEVQAALGEAFAHLTSRDPRQFWTSGQWMTERGGGSDVGRGTETVAVPEAAGESGVGCWFRLHGYKWFTSAADGEMSMALAREQPAPVAGSGGSGELTLFYVPVTRDAGGRPQGFEVVRLKNKLGTRQLPTAELRLTGMRALKISEAGRGVPAIAAMVNVTRLHNAAAAASYMRRITALAQDYARRRMAFGALLIDQPLARRALAWLHLHTAGSLAFTLEVARLLGLSECGAGTAEDAHMLRLLTPLAKLFTTKEAVAVASEGIEFFGGQGYIESTHLPVILRDAQVLPIWEGATSVLCLDVLRVLHSSPAAAAAFLHQCTVRLDAAMAAAEGAPGGGESGGATSGSVASGSSASKGCSEARPGAAPPSVLLRRACLALQRGLPAIGARLQAAAAAGPASAAAQVGARDLSFDLARTFVGVLLAEHAAWSQDEAHVLLAAEWCRECLRSGGTAAGDALPDAAELASTDGSSSATHSAASGSSSSSSGTGSDGGSSGRSGALEAAARAQLRAARVLSGSGRPLSQPRARY